VVRTQWLRKGRDQGVQLSVMHRFLRGRALPDGVVDDGGEVQAVLAQHPAGRVSRPPTVGRRRAVLALFDEPHQRGCGRSSSAPKNRFPGSALDRSPRPRRPGLRGRAPLGTARPRPHDFGKAMRAKDLDAAVVAVRRHRDDAHDALALVAG